MCVCVIGATRQRQNLAIMYIDGVDRQTAKRTKTMKRISVVVPFLELFFPPDPRFPILRTAGSLPRVRSVVAIVVSQSVTDRHKRQRWSHNKAPQQKSASYITHTQRNSVEYGHSHIRT